MNLPTFGIVLSGVLLNVAAQLLLKAGARTLGVLTLSPATLPATIAGIATQPHVLVGLAFYVLSAGLWIVALSRVDVVLAYPMLSLGYVLNALLAWQLFGEQLSAGRIAGTAIILLGVLVLARS